MVLAFSLPSLSSRGEEQREVVQFSGYQRRDTSILPAEYSPPSPPSFGLSSDIEVNENQ